VPAEPAAKAPAVTLQSVEQELAALSEMRRKDPKAYWSPANQAREVALIEQQHSLRTGRTAAVAASTATAQAKAGESEPAGEDGEGEASAAEKRLGEIDAELAELREKRRDARGEARDKIDARELELLREAEVTHVGAHTEADVAEPLLERWSGQGGTERLGILAGFARSLYESMSESEAMAFAADLRALPVAVRTEIYDQMSVLGGVGLEARREAVMAALSGKDRAAAEGFWKKHEAAIVKGLVG
jgi:hypothetical protein